MSAFKTVTVIAKNEVRLLLRERTLYLLLAIFVIMTILSTVIGWSTIHTITNVYEAAVHELSILGQTAPPFPVSSTPLGIMTNMIVYTVLIGSLLAIVLGYFVGIHDKMYNVTKIVFTRPIHRRDIFLGKSSAVVAVLGLVTLTAFLVSCISLGIFGVFSLTAIGHVFLFYLLSYVYMIGFAFLAMAFAFAFSNTTSAMLYALFVWMILTFALPELGSALYPTSSLNPILPPTQVLESKSLNLAHTITYPFSVSEHYKSLSATLLKLTPRENEIPTPVTDGLIVGLWGFLTFILSLQFFTSLKPSADYE